MRGDGSPVLLADNQPRIDSGMVWLVGTGEINKVAAKPGDWGLTKGNKRRFLNLQKLTANAASTATGKRNGAESGSSAKKKSGRVSGGTLYTESLFVDDWVHHLPLTGRTRQTRKTIMLTMLTRFFDCFCPGQLAFSL